MAVKRSKEQQLDRYLAVVEVTADSLELPSLSDTAALARGTFLVDSSGTPVGPSAPVAETSSPTDVAVSLTRTNDTNAYAANDVVGAATGSTAALTFAAVAASGKSVLITGTELEIDITAIPSGMTSFNLALYSVTPPSALGDSAAWDLPSGDRASFLGLINLGSPVDLGSTLYVRQTGLNVQMKLAGTAVYGYLITAGAYTPAASSVFKVTLHSLAL